MLPKILISDDDRAFVEVLQQRLEASGFHTICAYEGLRTIQKAHEESPDLILLDWMMPAGHGGNVLKSLREKDDTHAIPVIVITGASGVEIEEICEEYGVKAIFRKPFDSRALIMKIREILEWEKMTS